MEEFGLVSRNKVFGCSLALALGLLLVAGLSWATDPYPTRTIRWVVPWPAGGVVVLQAQRFEDCTSHVNAARRGGKPAASA
jgi:hypothetical protein